MCQTYAYKDNLSACVLAQKYDEEAHVAEVSIQLFQLIALRVTGLPLSYRDILITNHPQSHVRDSLYSLDGISSISTYIIVFKSIWDIYVPYMSHATPVTTPTSATPSF